MVIFTLDNLGQESNPGRWDGITTNNPLDHPDFLSRHFFPSLLPIVYVFDMMSSVRHGFNDTRFSKRMKPRQIQFHSLGGRRSLTSPIVSLLSS